MSDCLKTSFDIEIFEHYKKEGKTMKTTENKNIFHFVLKKVSYNPVTIAGWGCFGGVLFSTFMISFVSVPAAMAMTGLTFLILSIILIPVGYTMPKKTLFEFDD